MPCSVYSPLRHMSHSPTAQFAHGTGSGMPHDAGDEVAGRAARSPRAPRAPGPSDSWPRIRCSSPGGAWPYCAGDDLAVGPADADRDRLDEDVSPAPRPGSGMSRTAAESAWPGVTVSARMRGIYASARQPGAVGLERRDRRAAPRQAHAVELVELEHADAVVRRGDHEVGVRAREPVDVGAAEQQRPRQRLPEARSARPRRRPRRGSAGA